MHESQLTIEEIKTELEKKGRIEIKPLCAHCSATLFYELAKLYPDAYLEVYGKKTVYTLYAELEEKSKCKK